MRDPLFPRVAISPGRQRGLLALFVLWLVGSRFFALTADPPHELCLHYLSDEGWYSHTAREHAVFGRWIMDEHTPGLFWTPLYTLALRAVYQLIGWGLWQTRAMTAGSGIATCLCVYGFLRASHGARAAMYSAVLLAANFLWFSYNRVAFVETFQAMLIVASMLAVAAATRRQAWAVAAGILFGLAVLAKISALTMGIAIGAFWLWQLIVPLGEATAARARLAILTNAVLFTVAGGGIACAAWLILVRPNEQAFAASIRQLALLTSNQSPLVGVFTLGLGRDDIQLFTLQFVFHTALLLVGATLTAIRQLVIRQTPLDATTRLSWCWLVLGLAAIGMRSHFDFDRRYLAMLPPLAILLGIELSQSGLTIVSRHDLAGRERRWYRWLSVGLVGLVLGFALRADLASYLWHASSERTLENSRGLGQPASAAIAWALVTVGAVVLLWPMTRWLPARRLQIPAGIVLAVILGVDGVKTGLYFSDLTYRLPEAAEQFAAIGNRLPRDSRIAVGDTADTLGMGTDFFTFVIRRWDHNRFYMNLDGWQRFKPNIALTHHVEDGFVHIIDLPLAPDRQGHARVIVPVYVRETYADAARDALSPN